MAENETWEEYSQGKCQCPLPNPKGILTIPCENKWEFLVGKTKLCKSCRDKYGYLYDSRLKKEA